MRVEVLVLGREEGVDDQLRNRIDRNKQAALDRELGQHAAVAGVKPGQNRRLVVLELLIVRQAAAEMPQGDQGTSPGHHDEQNDQQQRPKKYFEHQHVMRGAPRWAERASRTRED